MMHINLLIGWGLYGVEATYDGTAGIDKHRIDTKPIAITTHDALTYSAKAATHKHVHPYLRYGILVGGQKNQALPGRLIKHGADFDFMLTWKEQDPNDGEWQHFCDLLRQEVDASRELEQVLTTNRSPKHKRYQSLHRKLVFE